MKTRFHILWLQNWSCKISVSHQIYHHLCHFLAQALAFILLWTTQPRKWFISLSYQRVCNITNRMPLKTQVMRLWRCWRCCFYFHQPMKSVNWRENYTFVIFCASVLGNMQERQHSAPTKLTVTWNDVWTSSFHSHGSSFLWWRLSFFSPVFRPKNSIRFEARYKPSQQSTFSFGIVFVTVRRVDEKLWENSFSLD